MRTPVLIIHGQSDANTFISNSKEMYHALRSRGVPVEFAHYPREGHGLREPGHKLDEMRRCLAWIDKYLKGAGEAQPLYRAGDKIVHDGYELVLVRVDDADFGWEEDPDAPRLLELAFSLTSVDAVEEGWEFVLSDVELRGPDGQPCVLRGVPTDFGGGRSLVEGSDLRILVMPDKETGRLGTAPALVFEIPADGGEFQLKLPEFPPIGFSVGPKDEKPEDEAAKERKPSVEDKVDHETALGSPDPIVTPQRPKETGG
jgi:hypothetical protein